MRKLLFLLMISSPIFGQVGINTNNPEAIFDIDFAKGGILIPRVSLSELTHVPVTSELVYNIETDLTFRPGFYFWNGTSWQKIIDSQQVLSVSEDQLSISDGNTITLPVLDEPVGTTYIVSLNNDWESRYDDEYRLFAYHVDRGVMHLTGVIDGSNADSPVFYTLPEHIRPTRRLLFLAYANVPNLNIAIRIELDGTIRVVGAPPFPSHVSLDGICFKIY